jgi:hypothetical protein
LLDGAKAPDLEDPDVIRLITIARVAEAFHVLPSQVARDLDEDPEQLSLVCLSVLQYAEAHDAEKRSQGEDDLKHWKGSKIMDMVIDTKLQLHKERFERRKRKANNASGS